MDRLFGYTIHVVTELFFCSEYIRSLFSQNQSKQLSYKLLSYAICQRADVEKYLDCKETHHELHLSNDKISLYADSQESYITIILVTNIQFYKIFGLHFGNPHTSSIKMCGVEYGRKQYLGSFEEPYYKCASFEISYWQLQMIPVQS